MSGSGRPGSARRGTRPNWSARWRGRSAGRGGNREGPAKKAGGARPEKGAEPPIRRGGQPTAAELVLAYLRDKAAVAAAWDVAVRLGEPDSVHQMRISVR